MKWIRYILLPCLALVIAAAAVFGQKPGAPAADRSGVGGERTRSVLLPAPTGPHAVGTRVFFLTDKNRKETVPGKEKMFRELTVQVWYPAVESKQAAFAPYLLEPGLFDALTGVRYLNLAPEVLGDWRELRTRSVIDAPAAGRKGEFPLLIFSHGFGMIRANYTTLLEEMASHGYVVAAIDHPYAGLTVRPDGRVLSNSADPRGPGAAAERVSAIARDALFTVGALLNTEDGPAVDVAKRINGRKIGMFGHSIGGAAALEACRTTAFFGACADLDGTAFGAVETEGVKRPFLVVLNVPAEAHRPPPEMARQRDEEWEAIIGKQNTPAFLAKIEGTFHLSFSDLPFIVPEQLFRKNGADLPAERGRRIVTGLLREFFGHALKNEEQADPAEFSKKFREIGLRKFN